MRVRLQEQARRLTHGAVVAHACHSTPPRRDRRAGTNMRARATQELKARHREVMGESLMDMLRALATPNMDIRKKTLDIALDLITSRNIDEARPRRRPGPPCAPRCQCRASPAVLGAASPPGREPERRSVFLSQCLCGPQLRRGEGRCCGAR
jgi:hypothetical protein